MTYLSIPRGDDGILDVVVTDRDTGDPIDLTGAELTFMVKRDRRDADADAILAKTVGSGITVAAPTTGIAVVAIDAADTDAATPGACWWELQSVDVTSKVHTLASGRFVITADLVREA